MQITSRYSLTPGILAAGLAGWVFCAAAQEAPVRPATVYALPAPPVGFDALLATDEERVRYGLPRRPSPLARNPLAYDTWKRVMSAAKIYVAPEVFATRHRHARPLDPHLTSSPGTSSPGTSSLGTSNPGLSTAGSFTSQNWTGQAIVSTAASYGPSSYAEVVSQWVVSAVQPPPNTCGASDVSAIWIGIDGINSNDVLQGGTEADVDCSGGHSTQIFYPWFEWYPDYEYEITNFPITAGTPILVVVQASSATNATVVYLNTESRQYTVAALTAPPGTVLRGNSAEWIVERTATGPNNTLGTLADFGMAMLTSEVGFIASEIGTNSYDVPGAPGGGRVPYNVTMQDSSGNALAYTRPQGTSAQEIDAVGTTIQ